MASSAPMTVKQYRQSPRGNAGPETINRAKAHLLLDPKFKGGDLHGLAACGRSSIGLSVNDKRIRRWNVGGDVACVQTDDLANITCLGCLRIAHERGLLMGVSWSALIENVQIAHRLGGCWGYSSEERIPEKIKVLLISMRREQLQEIANARQSRLDTLDWQERQESGKSARRAM